MARASSYFEDWFQGWSTLTQTFATRFQGASDKARDGTYGVDALLSDAIGTWADGFEAWYEMVFGRTAPRPGVLLLRMSQGTEAKQGTIRVTVPDDGSPEHTELARVGGGRGIPRENVQVQVSGALRNQLDVHLVDLGRVRPDAGQYMGVVHVGERLLAIVILVVT